MYERYAYLFKTKYVLQVELILENYGGVPDTFFFFFFVAAILRFVPSFIYTLNLCTKLEAE
jgi:hypothetical protein